MEFGLCLPDVWLVILLSLLPLCVALAPFEDGANDTPATLICEKLLPLARAKLGLLKMCTSLTGLSMLDGPHRRCQHNSQDLDMTSAFCVGSVVILGSS